MKLNTKFFIIILLTILETFGLVVFLLIGMQKATTNMDFQYRQARMQLHLSECVNYVNNVNNYSVEIATVYDKWQDQVKLLEDDIDYLTGDNLDKLSAEMQETVKYIPVLWKSVRNSLLYIGDEFKKVVSDSILNIGGTEGEETSNIPQPLFKERTFEEVMDSVVKLVTTKFMETDNMDYVKEITDRNLGVGRLISECERRDKEALEIIEVELENKAEELGI